MTINSGVAATLSDYLTQLGGISADRVRLSPLPGQATFADCVAANEHEPRGLCELVDGTLVEKAAGYEASIVGATILAILNMFVSSHKLGLVSGADGFFRLPSSTRGPNVAFVSRDRLPNGAFPQEAYRKSSPTWLSKS